ncbi:MAG TPA: response regulator [Candidatus Limnocylindria bacterium]|nr:response regulator [Candidatus Limnocylindria bacterium]
MNALRNSQVLLVDNDRSVRESLKNALETEGLAVCAIPGDEEAVHRFAAGCFDLVLLDFSANESGQWNLLNSFRRVNPDVKVIIITVVRELVPAALATGAVNAFEKPLRIPELLLSVRNILTPPEAVPGTASCAGARQD